MLSGARRFARLLEESLPIDGKACGTLRVASSRTISAHSTILAGECLVRSDGFISYYAIFLSFGADPIAISAL